MGIMFTGDNREFMTSLNSTETPVVTNKNETNVTLRQVAINASFNNKNTFP